MTPPYRTMPARPPGGDDDAPDPDAWVVVVLVGALGGLRLAVALALHERAGAEVTIALAMVVLAAAGVAARIWRRRGRPARAPR